jgi:hypothetical protein
MDKSIVLLSHLLWRAVHVINRFVAGCGARTNNKFEIQASVHNCPNLPSSFSLRRFSPSWCPRINDTTIPAFFPNAIVFVEPNDAVQENSQEAKD